ncbi:hypothetical protein L208DRAFT_1376584 [Tricholoma matsutake]|nr:hypothetical protein L208DRAFT_1376584 [Tricholoma matsutake 945]
MDIDTAPHLVHPTSHGTMMPTAIPMTSALAPGSSTLHHAADPQYAMLMNACERGMALNTDVPAWEQALGRQMTAMGPPVPPKLALKCPAQHGSDDENILTGPEPDYQTYWMKTWSKSRTSQSGTDKASHSEGEHQDGTVVGKQKKIIYKRIKEQQERDGTGPMPTGGVTWPRCNSQCTVHSFTLNSVHR